MLMNDPDEKLTELILETSELMRSPSMRKKRFEHEIENDNKVWHSCCINIDKQCFKYCSQLFIIYSIILFAIRQLIMLHSCESQQFLALLTVLIGLTVDGPKYN